MDNFWKEAVKATGSIAVVGFILTLLVENIFQENVLVIFGSDRAYYLTAFIAAALAVALVLSVILHKKRSQGNEDNKSSVQNRVVTIDRSKVTGDVVLGDKSINQDRNRDE